MNFKALTLQWQQSVGLIIKKMKFSADHEQPAGTVQIL